MGQQEHLILSKIYIYPIKSMGEVALHKSVIDDFGLYLDRRWMLVNKNNTFITQRQMPSLCFFQCELTQDSILVTHKSLKEFKVEIPIVQDNKELILVQVWEDSCEAYEVSADVSKAFSEVLGEEVKLVYMPNETKRQVDKTYTPEGVFTSFTDGFPALLIGEASLDELNTKLSVPVEMLRFRPNLVFSGGYPFLEDYIKDIIIGTTNAQVVKPCSRCVVTTIDRETGLKGVEPLKTLSQYRLKDNKVIFGQNVVLKPGGKIEVGEKISVLTEGKLIF